MSASLPQDISAIILRVERTEQDIKDVRTQLQSYVPIRENDLRLQSISETVHRIEADVAKIKDQLTDMNSKLTAQEKEARQRDVDQEKSQAQLQIRVLWGVVAGVITVGSGILIAYVTHFFH